MRVGKYRTIIRVIGRGARLRCPSCGLGQLYDGALHMRAICPYCDVRFERSPGESMGAVYVNAILTVCVALIGFFMLDALLRPAILPHLLAWSAFTLLFPLLSYRVVRSLWVSVACLTGGVYPDPDYEREWIAPRRPAVRRRTKE